MTDLSQPRPEAKHKPIRSYVIRSGRMTDSQKHSFDRHWRQYGLSLHDGAFDAMQTFGRQAPLIVEIGFGMGDTLLEMAQAAPTSDFIGIEVHPPGIGRLINLAAKNQVDNLRVYMADANDVLADCIADNSIGRVQIFFPDPWHKKKHHKRRLVQQNFIELIATKLERGGVLHLATDWEPYAKQMLTLLDGNIKLRNLAGHGSYSPRPSYRPVTKFERRGAGLGHGVWDLLFERLA